MLKEINRAAKLLKEKDSFLITTHTSADGDALGSVSALSCALKLLNKNVNLFLSDDVSYEFSFLKGMNNFAHDINSGHYDVLIVVDCANLNRIGSELSHFKSYDTMINIDHHNGNKEFGDVNVVDKDACSAGILIYKILKAGGIEITKDIAEAIYTTILVDTGSFRYSNATSEAFLVAAEMIEKGVNTWSIAEQVYENQPLSRINLLKLVLSKMEVHVDKGFASVTVTKNMMKAANADLSVTDGFINFPRSVKGVEVALFFKEVNRGKYKLSLRSKGKADVSMVAETFGGGGHKNAAGCYLTGTLNDVKAVVFGYLEKYLKNLK